MAEQKSSYTYEELLSCARGEMFGKGNAQLPAPPMLMFNRITKISENGGEHDKGLIRAEFDINPDLWFLPVILLAIRSCLAVWGLMPCGNSRGFSSVGWGNPVKGALFQQGK